MKQKGTFTDTTKRFRTICTESGETVTVGIADTTTTQGDKVTERHKSVYLLIGVEADDGTQTETAVFLDHTQADEIAALQKEAADALNKLLQAMRAAGFPVYTPVHFWGLAFEPKQDEDFNLYYKPTDLTGADCLKHGYGKEDEEPDTEPFVWKPTQQKEPHHINSTSGHNVRIIGGRKE